MNRGGGGRGWNRNQRGRRGGRDGNSPNWRGNARHHPYQHRDERGGGRFQKRNYGDRNFGQKQFDRPKYPTKRLSEQEIAVTEYISDHSGFKGIIKSRYSDFQVSEINNAGQVAKLTDLSCPKPPVEEDVVEDEELLLSKYNVEILPMETWDRINKLVVSTEPSEERVEIDVTGKSKEDRTKIHDAVKKAFGEAMVGSTVTVDDKKFVRFERYRKGVKIDNRQKWVWPGEYVHFILHKENCDTMEAANKIAERLNIYNVKPQLLGYAGTKDRRAKTSQWFSLRKTEPKRIARACAHMREIHVGNFTFSDTHLRLGMLRGNRFRIALRNVTSDSETISSVCEDLKTKGFINYYGLQRFGTRAEMPTYEVGLKLLQGDFKEAINAILQERQGPEQHYRSNNSLEARLSAALRHNSKDLVQALDKVPRNTRLLYIHSYQSLIWNKCVSERIKRFGLTPAVGDLVLVEDELNEECLDGDVEESDSEENGNSDEKEKKSDDDDIKSNEKNNRDELKPKIPVKSLTQEDLDSGNYTIFNVILPLPGYNIDYPDNMKTFYEELLTKDNLKLDMKHKVKAYSMSGAYRHMVIRPEQVEWSIVKYSDPFCDLLLSDYDEVEKKELTGIVPDGKYQALLLTLTLPASCYATMALREVLRSDTSGDSQAAQNDYHKEDTGKRKCDDDDKEDAKKVKLD